ncbi:MAG: undecaprenyl/decaprenyl-phosphate alpha-N-acetylglucosaminyl 1-phosphate transferase, partial [Sedimentisphaerales bacterium]|nr:undecaprenyl/decaprenyl-phosphate alpha-N-acetylglucosaminyl 1-phosphate transferase [Sedimentisphaerales bacterium]
KTYLAVYLGSSVLAILATAIVIRIARRFHIVDIPGVRKVHSEPVPRIGGVAIFVSMIGLVIPVFLLPNDIGETFRLVQSQILTLLGAAGFMFLVGLVDDIKGLRVRTKFYAQLISAMVICSVGMRIESIPVTASLTIHFGWFSWIFTIVWIIGITNAINLSDGLDGLAAGISAIACGVIAVLAIYNSDTIMAILMLALLGSLTGFLLFNFEPAKTFMGDSGSMFLGFTIASASVLSATKTETIVGLALPILALGIPIFDTLFSMLRRFLERRSMFSPDRSHFHHRLLALGLHQRHVVLTAYLITLLAAGLGMFMLVTRNSQTIVIFICTLLLLVLVFRVVGSIRLRDMIAELKRKHTITSQKKQELEAYENIELHFRQVEKFDEWWQAICFAAGEMDFASSSLRLVERSGAEKILIWKKDNEVRQEDELVRMIVPVRDRRANSSLNIEVQVYANGSLESVGRRLTLFSRLIEKYSVENLYKT